MTNILGVLKGSSKMFHLISAPCLGQVVAAILQLQSNQCIGFNNILIFQLIMFKCCTRPAFHDQNELLHILKPLT
jgi:hypothetical protein